MNTERIQYDMDINASSVELPASISADAAAITLSGNYNTSQSASGDILVKADTVINSRYPAAIQVLKSGATVTVEGGSLNCNSIRNAAILFGDDAYWEDQYGYGAHLDGTVTFTGAVAALNSVASNCITAGGIIGNNLTVNFTGAANGSAGIVLSAINGSGPANEAFGIHGGGSVTINGTFGGSISAFFDFSTLASKRWAEVYGIAAAENLTIKGGISGTIIASAYTEDTQYSWIQSNAYGLYSGTSLSVSGDISGTIAALAETTARAIYASDIQVSISGTVFAGKSKAGQTLEQIKSLLSDPQANKETLKASSSGSNAIYAYTGNGSVNILNGAMIFGDVRLRLGTLTVSSGAEISGYVWCKSLNFVLDAAPGAVVIGNGLDFSTISVKADTAVDGTYVLVGNLSAGSASAVRQITVTRGSQTVDLSWSKTTVSLGSGETFSYSINGSNLIFTVSGCGTPQGDTEAQTNLLSNGYSQIVAWDSEKGKVGYVATNGQTAPAWAGIWEWGSSEAAMWKVVGVGRFSADVAHDGILLYNGIGNTFAAWTDLGRGDYGYVSLCHVDGNFQTLTLADFDNNGLDDVIIYDEKGSFGIVSDAAAYHDVWHVDNAATNVQKVIGAGYFGNADGKSDILVKKTDENAYFLWHNQDSTFNTWNWSQTYLGSLDNDWEVAAIGDFQGDGVDDIIMWQKSTGFMYAWEDGKSSNQRWVGALNASQWEVAAVGDYNGDGKEDLLLRELLSGWGGVGYWAGANASNWTDLNARIETDMESKFAVVA